MAAIDILRVARGYVADGWTQGELARDGERISRMPWDPRACSFCMRGAVVKAVGSIEIRGDAGVAHKALCDAIGSKRIPKWNDAANRTKAEVLAAFDRAIASLEVAP